MPPKIKSDKLGKKGKIKKGQINDEVAIREMKLKKTIKRVAASKAMIPDRDALPHPETA